MRQTMRHALIASMIVLLSCTAEHGAVSATACPCPHAYDGFDTCAFFDINTRFAHPQVLVDDENNIFPAQPVHLEGYMHHKFCFNESHAVFGSANPTTTGLQKNDNLVVHIQSKQLAAAFAKEYAYLLGHGSGAHKTRWSLNDLPLSIYFCPRDMCELRVLEEIHKAEQSITLFAFSFTSTPISHALQVAHTQGIRVQIIQEPLGFSRGQGPTLVQQNIPVWLAQTPGVMHHKAFIIDNTTAIIGSYNPTLNANTYNAETLVITKESAIIDTLNREFIRLRSSAKKAT